MLCRVFARLGSSSSVRMLSSIPRKSLRGVVFDIDGTLTVPNLDFKVMYARCGVPPAADIIEAVAAMPSAEKAAAESVIEELEEESRRTLQLMPGAKAVVKFLHQRDLPTAVVTRNTGKTIEAVTQLLAAQGVDRQPCFEPAISRLEDFAPKPDPASLFHIAKAWGVPPAEILMIGDSPSNDVAYAKAAGAHTILLDTGRRHTEGGSTGGADFVVENLDEVPRLLREYFAVAELKAPGVVEADPKIMITYDPPAPSTDAAIAARANNTNALAALHAAGRLLEPCASGNTPLIWAADACALEAVQFLLTVDGIDANAKGYLGATAVNRAARRGCANVLKALVDSPLVTSESLDAPNDKLQFPLHFAAFKRNPEAVDVLLAAGASPNVVDRKGRRPDEDTDVLEIQQKIKAARESYA